VNFEQGVSSVFIIGILASSIRLAMPILLAGLGELFSEKAGILNIGMEGMILMGALGAFLGSYISGSPWLGVLTGMLCGLLMSLIHAFLTIRLAADQVVSGIAINILSLGLSVFIFRAFFGITTSLPMAPGFEIVQLPWLSEIPFLGPILFRHQILVYLGLLFVPLAYVLLMKTTFGLMITAVGEDPHAADAVGINVVRVRTMCVLIGGLMSGLAGAFLSLGSLSTFQETIVAGRGFIAVAVVMFGRWNPVGALFAALLFGFADAFQLHLQAFSNMAIPPQVFHSLPYLTTIIVMLTGLGKAAVPAAMCVPFIKEK